MTFSHKTRGFNIRIRVKGRNLPPRQILRERKRLWEATAAFFLERRNVLFEADVAVFVRDCFKNNLYGLGGGGVKRYIYCIFKCLSIMRHQLVYLSLILKWEMTQTPPAVTTG